MTNWRGAQRPLLRTPPFPHTRRERVAISHCSDQTHPLPGPDDVDAIFAALRDARVGGAFWSPSSVWSLPETASIRATGDDERIAIGAIRGLSITVTKPGRFGNPTTGPDHMAIARHIIVETSYRDPFDGRALSAFEAITLLAFWARQIESNRDIAVAIGFAWWKRREIATFLWAGGPRPPRFVRSDAAACRIARARGGAIAVWPSRVSTALLDRAAAQHTPIIRVEDGFIRSVGLGVNLHPPYSVTVDRRGIHYDPSRPSDLEHLLETAEFSPDLLARAAALRETIVTHRISKYGGGETGTFPSRTPGRRLVLVPGQVSDDLSVLNGGGDVNGNADLLRRTRALEPAAEIWFRPHPDVDSGLRRGALSDPEALRYADRIVRGGGLAELLGYVDGVHVLTSLAGFEALLRGRDVTTHGTPFYSGWGLTQDLAQDTMRRRRRLAIDGLIAGTLILYPRYLDPMTGLPCQVETLVENFVRHAHPRIGLLAKIRSVQGRLIRSNG